MSEHSRNTTHRRPGGKRQNTRCCTVRVARRPAPGTHNGAICWTSRQHWLTVVVELVLRQREPVLREHHVDADTFRRYLAALAQAADHHSGRGIQLTTRQIGDRVGISDVHVRRCRRAAEALGLYVIVQHGRLMTKAERIRAWKAGSRHRGLANEAVLVVPEWVIGHLGAGAASHQPSGFAGSNTVRNVDDVRPPSDTPVGGIQTVSSGFVTADAARMPAPPAATRTSCPPKPRPKRRWRCGYRLAVALVARVRWLCDLEPGRIAGQLARFERCRIPWTAADIVAAIDVVHGRLGWSTPTRDRLRAPGYALLAWYLRGLDPDADHPRAHPEWYQALGAPADRHAPGAIRAQRDAVQDVVTASMLGQHAGGLEYLAARRALRQPGG